MEFDFNAAEAEYFGINADDDDALLELKQAIYSELNEAERRVLSIYIELGTYAAVAKVFGISANAIKNKIRKIRWKLS